MMFLGINTFLSQPEISIIRSQRQPEFCPTGEHAIRLIGALSCQIVHQDSQIAFGPLNGKWRPLVHLPDCVDASNDSLGSSFFVACCSIDLSREEEILHQAGFQIRFELSRVNKVILNSIT